MPLFLLDVGLAGGIAVIEVGLLEVLQVEASCFARHWLRVSVDPVSLRHDATEETFASTINGPIHVSSLDPLSRTRGCEGRRAFPTRWELRCRWMSSPVVLVWVRLAIVLPYWASVFCALLR